MRPPSPTFEIVYAHDRRNHRHRCRCCGICLEAGDKALMVKVGAFTKRSFTTWAIHLSCADKDFSTGASTTNIAGWTWRDAFDAWGTEHLRRCGWHKVPEHPMARPGAIKTMAPIAATLAVMALINIFAIYSAKADIRITSDPGGNLQTYQAAVESVRRSGEKVVIDGPCNSACTLWLTLPNSQLCVTARAVFGFHAATNSDTSLPNPSATDALWHSYPARVQIAIGKRGGLWIQTIYVPGREVARGCR